MKQEVYVITGMSCAACSSAVERVTRRLGGVSESFVNLTTGKMTIVYDETALTPEKIITTVEKAGFGAEIYVPEAPKADTEAEDIARRGRDLIGAAILSALLLYISMGQMRPVPLPVPAFLKMHSSPVIFTAAQLILATPVLYFGRRFFINGFKALFHLAPNMDSLVAVGSGCSYLYSLCMAILVFAGDHGRVHDLYFESSAVVITLVMLGKYFEARSKRKTKSAITGLMELSPDTALLMDGEETRGVPTDTLRPGDAVRLKPGAKFPADGEVLEGMGSVNEAMLTGESLPVPKEPGDTVIGGSINLDGAFRVRLTRTGADTTLSGIIKLVEEAQGKKAPVSRFADKVAGVFVPVVMGIALLAAIIWAITGAQFSFVLRIFTSVLVIACPCALGLATPTAIMVGTGMGAQHGILLRSGEALETARGVTCVVFDKTGTVTEGKPAVSDICGDKDRTLAVACALEKLSSHPLSGAVVEAAAGMNTPVISEFENVPGRGLSGILPGGKPVLAGSRLLLTERGVDVSPLLSDAEKLAASGKTLIYVSEGTELLGVIGVSDKIRRTSADAVKRLHEMGIKTCMLTGDTEAAAKSIGNAAGFDEIFAGVLPDGKAEAIEKLRESGENVMMVGDGINDAPALTAADIGAAMGGGSDIAVDAGDIVLMRSDPMDIPKAINLSRLTLRNIKQNLFWAFFYNVIFIPVAAGVLYPAFGLLLSPMFAGFAMSLSSVCVVTNALRLRFKKL